MQLISLDLEKALERAFSLHLIVFFSLIICAATSGMIGSVRNQTK
jgi:hypothetical protein